MSTIHVGVGEMKSSILLDDVVKTYGLGSCIGLVALSPKHRAVGMIHIALPESKINPEMAQARPCVFADTGIPIFLQKMESYGCQHKDLIFKMAGGASILDPSQRFEIGKRNILAVKKILWRYRLGAIAEDVGGDYSRTVSIQVATGRVMLSSPGRGEWEI